MTQEKIDQAAPELLPCPFCGSVEMLRRVGEIESDGWGFVRCDYCDAEGPAPASLPGHWNHRADLAAPSAQHPDDAAVDRFATAMKAKLAKKRADGRGGWEIPECTAETLSRLLREHVEKGDPLDVGNLSMMLHQRGERIAAPHAPADVDGLASLHAMIEQVDAIYDSRLAREARDELTALQAQNERLRGELDNMENLYMEQRKAKLNANYHEDKQKSRAEKAEAALAAGLDACDQFDGPVSSSEFVNGQATCAQQIRAKLKGDV